MGVGQPANKKEIVDYVLGEFSKKEKSSLDAFIDEAVLCCCKWLKEGVGPAMEVYNKKS